MVKAKICSFSWRISKWKEKRTTILTFRSGDLNPRFSLIFPPMIWIFMWSEEPEIISKQASKIDRTLLLTHQIFSQIPNFSRVDILDDLIRISSNLCKDDSNLSWSYVSSFSGFVCICRGKWHFLKELFFIFASCILCGQRDWNSDWNTDWNSWRLE